MASVSELVKQKVESRKQMQERIENETLQRHLKHKKETFSREVRDIIKRFEISIFDINSTNEKVAEVIATDRMNWICGSEIRFEEVSFFTNEKPQKILIRKSSKFNRWKKELEDKFGIDIFISRRYRRERRFGNSGYETYPDEVYQGVIASISLKE